VIWNVVMFVACVVMAVVVWRHRSRVRRETQEAVA